MRPPGGRVLAGVAEQIAQHLREPHDVATDHRVAAQLKREFLVLLLQRALRGLDRALDRVAQAHPSRLEAHVAAMDAADVEQVVDEAAEVLRLPLDDAQRPRRLVVVVRLQAGGGGGHQDRRERIAQLVREHRHELRHLPVVGFQCFQPAPFGHVARDLREPAQLATLLVVQRGDHHVRPEPRAVLAHAPAFVLEAALGGGEAQFRHRPAGAVGFLRVEAREMVADDLFGAVALDAFGAFVPADDDALRIEREDRVVAHAVHQQPEQFVAVGRRIHAFPPDAW